MRFTKSIAAMAGLSVAILAATARADNASYVYGNSSANQNPAELDLLVFNGTSIVPVVAPIAPSPFQVPFSLSPADYAGYYSSDDVASNIGLDNYLAGANVSSLNYNSFLVYNLSGIHGIVVGASERIYTSQVQTAYMSLTGSSTGGSNDIALFDINTSLNAIPVYDSFGFPDSYLSGAGVYGDLGSGNLYGVANYTSADDNAYKSILLDPSAIADLNNVLSNAGGIDPAHTVNGQLEFGIGHTEIDSPVPTPLPSGFMAGTVLMGGLALAGIWNRRRVAVRA